MSYLNKTYKNICIQDDDFNQWKLYWGKQIHHSVLGRVKSKLLGLSKTRVVDRFAPTTQLCPHCLERTKLDLNERIFTCNSCGFTAPRDQKSALVIKLIGMEHVNTPVEKQTSWIEANPKFVLLKHVAQLSSS